MRNPFCRRRKREDGDEVGQFPTSEKDSFALGGRKWCKAVSRDEKIPKDSALNPNLFLPFDGVSY